MTNSEKEIIQKAITDMVDSMTRVSAERDLQKETVRQIKETTTVTPKVFRKMARTAFNANFSEEVAVHEEFEELYIQLMGE